MARLMKYMTHEGILANRRIHRDLSHVSIFKEVIAKREEMVQEQQQELREVQGSHSIDQEILECVMKGLAGYGDDIPKMVVYNLKWMSRIRRDEIPDKAEEFEKCLDEIFDSDPRLSRNQ